MTKFQIQYNSSKHKQLQLQVQEELARQQMQVYRQLQQQQLQQQRQQLLLQQEQHRGLENFQSSNIQSLEQSTDDASSSFQSSIVKDPFGNVNDKPEGTRSVLNRLENTRTKFL